MVEHVLLPTLSAIVKSCLAVCAGCCGGRGHQKRGSCIGDMEMFKMIKRWMKNGRIGNDDIWIKLNEEKL